MQIYSWQGLIKQPDFVGELQVHGILESVRWVSTVMVISIQNKYFQFKSGIFNLSFLRKSFSKQSEPFIHTYPWPGFIMKLHNMILSCGMFQLLDATPAAHTMCSKFVFSIYFICPFFVVVVVDILSYFVLEYSNYCCLDCLSITSATW